MNAIVLYDITGRIYDILYGESNPPQGVPYLIMSAEQAANLSHIDVSDPEAPVPVLREEKESFDIVAAYQEQQNQINDIVIILADVIGGAYA